MSRITLVKLAELLNLSKSTVGRAFDPDSGMNSQTRAKVLKLAAKYNFQPDHSASSLRKRSSATISIIVPEIANNFFAQAIRGIENYARQNRFSVLIYVTDGLLEKEQEHLSQLIDGRVDGIILSASGEDKDHHYITQSKFQKIPMVFFDRTYSEVDAPKVVTDDYQSSFKATERLIKSGCKTIACAVINKSVSIGLDRVSGFADALKKYNLPFTDASIIDCSNDLESNRNHIKDFLKKNKPDGIIATVERLAFAIYYVCQEENIVVPDDLKIISFSSLEIAPLLNPPLSTITQPAYKMGQKAAELLFQKIKKELTDNPTIVMKSKLVHRKSSEQH